VRRKLFNVVSVLSLLLCLATVVLWVRGIHNPLDFYGRVLPKDSPWPDRFRVGAEHGFVTYESRHPFATGDPEKIRPFLRGPESSRPLWPLKSLRHQVGIAADEMTEVGEIRMHRFSGDDDFNGVMSGTIIRRYSIRLWLVVVVLAVLPLTWVNVASRNLYRRGALRRGGCPTCHYNLTGNTSGICPECGSPAVPSLNNK